LVRHEDRFLIYVAWSLLTMKTNHKFILLLFVYSSVLFAQTPELETAQTKLTRIWGGIAANGERATFDFRAGFFPNDYDILQHRDREAKII
jgi:hypothetical protein